MTPDPTPFHLGLLYLTHLLIGVDGDIDERERALLLTLQSKEKIPDSTFHQFETEVRKKKEKEVFQAGLHYINQCTEQEKLRTFVHLYRTSQVDGRVHVKEVRLLLYSTKMAGVEFEDVRKSAEAPV